MQIYNFFRFLLSTILVFFFIIPKFSFSESTKKEGLLENVDCMDDGRLVDISCVGAMIGLIVVFFWHIIRICCISRMAAAHYPSNQKPPLLPSSAKKTSSLEIQIEDEEIIFDEEEEEDPNISIKSNTNAECSRANKSYV